MKDYYELLEVSKNASDDTIKKVFRMLIKKNHPDLFEGEEKIKAEEKVKALNEAYEVLINKDKRQKYDLELEEYNKVENESLQILIEENEYLKSVIKEKNRVIKEFLNDMETNSGELFDNSYYSEYEDTNEYEATNVGTEEGYYLYTIKHKIKRFLYILTLIIVGAIALWIATGINLFKIFL